MEATIAAIDLGSNTVKMLVARRDPSGALEVLRECADITRIGQDVDRTGALAAAAMARTIDALRRFAGEASAFGATRTSCIATAGLRGPANAHDFVGRVRHEVGLEIEIIDGLREAELAYRVPSVLHPRAVVVDIGGRSTEIITGNAGTILERASLEIGSVRLTERFLAHDPPLSSEVKRLMAHVREVLALAPVLPTDAQLIGVSGTVVSIMGVALDLFDIERAVECGEGRPLSRTAVERALADFMQKPARDRIRGTVLPEGRADVIVAGAAIVLAVLDHYRASDLLVSSRGVRYGLACEMLGIGPDTHRGEPS